jgi:hypothetical protein
MDEDSSILGDTSSSGLERRAYGGDKMLGEHFDLQRLMGSEFPGWLFARFLLVFGTSSFHDALGRFESLAPGTRQKEHTARRLPSTCLASIITLAEDGCCSCQCIVVSLAEIIQRSILYERVDDSTNP